jgi:uncharacterized protein (TIGR01777 family)
MTRVVITGATGTVGSALCAALLHRGDQVTAISRDAQRARAVLGDRVQAFAWARPTQEPLPPEALAGSDAVVHLLGEPLDQRWTEGAKAEIRDSRVRATRSLVQALQRLPADARPGVLVSQSATGFYGPSDDRELDERAAAGADFLAGVVRAWEAEASAAESTLRAVQTRTGVVLSTRGGALARMLPFFRLGLGGPVAGGRQYLSWIHVDDVVGGLLFVMEDSRAAGPVNLTSPNPVTNAEFSRALGRALRRPAVLPVPALALRLLYGDMAEIVTTGQRVVPRRLRELGFEFRHPAVEPALRDALLKR